MTIIEQIRDNLTAELASIEPRRRTGRITKPRYMTFEEKGSRTVQIYVKKPLLDIQAAGSAFEGYAFVIRRWTANTNVVLDWEPNRGLEGIDNVKYNRFCFRANELQIFYNWFSVSERGERDIRRIWTEESDIKWVVNSPGKDSTAVVGKATDKKEWSEKQIQRYLQTSDHLKRFLKVENLYLEQPLGLFINKKMENNRFLPTGRIDFLALDGLCVHIIELKWFKNGTNGRVANIPLNIIGELLYYTFLIYRILRRDFTVERMNKVLSDRCDLHQMQEDPHQPHTIKSWLLVPEIHPFIDKKLIADLNSISVPNNYRIKFDIAFLNSKGEIKLREA